MFLRDLSLVMSRRIFNNIKRENIFINFDSCVVFIELLWDIIHSGHKLCVCGKRIHIVGSETF